MTKITDEAYQRACDLVNAENPTWRLTVARVRKDLRNFPTVTVLARYIQDASDKVKLTRNVRLPLHGFDVFVLPKPIDPLVAEQARLCLAYGVTEDMRKQAIMAAIKRGIEIERERSK
tara:strand:- start:12937 stop:13290 length:354 start_codon:yes stop_codon:yes gene_type:complete